jgi:hypothetical protein
MPVPSDYLNQLLTNPGESLDVELKNWLDPTNAIDRPKIAKEIMALANYGGGYLVFGIDDKSLMPDVNRPQDMSIYSVDNVNAIVRRYADPSFHCELTWGTQLSSGLRFPIVRVPGGHQVPVRCKKGCPDQTIEADRYYFRLPGPESGQARTSKDWDDVIRRCLLNQKENLLSGIRSILSASSFELRSAPDTNEGLEEWDTESLKAWTKKLTRESGLSPQEYYPHGTWAISYRLLTKSQIVPMSKIIDAMESVSGAADYPRWNMAKKSVTALTSDSENTMEWFCFQPEPTHWRRAWTSYCRVRDDLSFFLKAGYIEDLGKMEPYPEPGKSFYTTNPVEFIYRTTQHAVDLVAKLQLGDPKIVMEISWTNSDGRTLAIFHNAVDADLISESEILGCITSWPTVKVKIFPIELSALTANFVDVISAEVEKVFRAFNFRMDHDRLSVYIERLVSKLRVS